MTSLRSIPSVEMTALFLENKCKTDAWGFSPCGISLRSIPPVEMTRLILGEGGGARARTARPCASHVLKRRCHLEEAKRLRDLLRLTWHIAF